MLSPVLTAGRCSTAVPAHEALSSLMYREIRAAIHLLEVVIAQSLLAD